jgi:hypothetical protein
MKDIPFSVDLFEFRPPRAALIALYSIGKHCAAHGPAINAKKQAEHGTAG